MRQDENGFPPRHSKFKMPFLLLRGLTKETEPHPKNNPMGKKGGDIGQSSRKNKGKVGIGGGTNNKSRQRGYQKKGYHDNFHSATREEATREDMLCEEVGKEAENSPLK
eukprot:scaffold2055_cov224-Chaetoceros_neogracile.AAC.9